MERKPYLCDNRTRPYYRGFLYEHIRAPWILYMSIYLFGILMNRSKLKTFKRLLHIGSLTGNVFYSHYLHNFDKIIGSDLYNKYDELNIQRLDWIFASLPIITWQLIFIDTYPKYKLHKLFFIPNLILYTNLICNLRDTEKQWNLFAFTFLTMHVITTCHIVLIKDKMYKCMNFLLTIAVLNGCMSGLKIKELFNSELYGYHDIMHLFAISGYTIGVGIDLLNNIK